MSDVNNKVWQNLISCIRETSGPKDDIYVFLVSKPVSNEFSMHRDFNSCADGIVEERDPRPLDDILLYIRAGEQGKVNQSYIGFTERVLDPDSAKVTYTPDAFRQINREAGVRLLRLSETGRDVYFASVLLGYESAKVTEDMLGKMLGSDKSRELGLVRVDILKKLGKGKDRA